MWSEHSAPSMRTRLPLRERRRGLALSWACPSLRREGVLRAQSGPLALPRRGMRPRRDAHFEHANTHLEPDEHPVVLAPGNGPRDVTTERSTS